MSDSSKVMSPLNLSKMLEELFLVLTSKEKTIIEKRFSLTSEPRQTLEVIGQHFNVTRERIRQIESIALNKLRRTVSSSKLKDVNDLIGNILEENGGILLEQDIIKEVLNRIGRESELDGSIIHLALTINTDLVKVNKSRRFDAFWRMKEVSFDDFKKVVNGVHRVLKKHNAIIPLETIITDFHALNLFPEKKILDKFILASMNVDKDVKEVEKGWGMSKWRIINPRSIKDKVLIILRKRKEKMHFIEIANSILNIGFGKKQVTVQAVHNELIRSSEFVLIGRGLYALSEWGYVHGTIADVLKTILKKKGPMHRNDIIKAVAKQRDIKDGTISLNLQKEPSLVRVGRAVYDYDPKLDKNNKS